MMKQIIGAVDVLQYEPYGFTNCVRYRDVLYLSGIGALDPKGKVVGTDIETQTAYIFGTIDKILRTGGSRLDQIIQMTSFVVNLEQNGARYVAARKKLLTRHDYTSATVGASALMIPGLLVEVQCCAAV